MSSGDAVRSIAQVTAGNYALVQPSAGIEWIIHNLFIPDGVAGIEVDAWDGTLSILLGTFSGPLLYCNFHCTNTDYIRIKNTTAGTINLGYDGIVVK